MMTQCDISRDRNNLLALARLLLSFIADAELHRNRKRGGFSKAMKKYFAVFVMMAMMAVMVPLMATTADAQTYRQREQSTYDKHRNIINIGIGAGAGAIVGAIAGGGRGAAIGAAVGAGGGALYTYVFNPKTKKYERRYYRR
jgi:hypothetical protein